MMFHVNGLGPSLEKLIQRITFFTGVGSSFGELALIDQSCLRTATIVADHLSDMIVIHRDLYSRMLKAAQKKDIDEKLDVIRTHPLFRYLYCISNYFDIQYEEHNIVNDIALGHYCVFSLIQKCTYEQN